MGLAAGSPQAAQGLSFLVFPLSFVSSAYVPVSTMPGWMQAFANNQPMTQMVNTVRLLTGGPAAQQLLGHSVSYYLVPSLLWTAGLVVVFAPLAVWKLKTCRDSAPVERRRPAARRLRRTALTAWRRRSWASIIQSM